MPLRGERVLGLDRPHLRGSAWWRAALLGALLQGLEHAAWQYADGVVLSPFFCLRHPAYYGVDRPQLCLGRPLRRAWSPRDSEAYVGGVFRPSHAGVSHEGEAFAAGSSTR